MTREKISTPDAPQPAGNYSQGIRLGNLVWTAGFGPQDPVTGEIPESVADQTRRVLRNVEATLAEAGLDLGDVVKTTVHLADLADFAEFDEAYGELGYPGGNFDEAIVRAIKMLVETPEAPADLVLQERPAYFEHDDPALRSLRPVQKQLLLTGPEHRRQVITWLRRFAATLALKID